MSSYPEPDYLAMQHDTLAKFSRHGLGSFLRTVATESAEDIVFVSERRGSVAVDSGGQRISSADRFVVFGIYSQVRVQGLCHTRRSKAACNASPSSCSLTNQWC